MVEHLGTRSKPWVLTASIRPGTGYHQAHLHGNISLPFIHGWVNFTSLCIDASAENFVLDFHISYPDTSTLAVSSVTFGVTPRPYFVTIVSAPVLHSTMNVGEEFSILLEVHDRITMQTAQSLEEKVRLFFIQLTGKEKILI